MLYKQNVAFTPNTGPPITQYVGQYALFPCSAAGARRPTPPSAPAFVGAIGARSGAVVAWSDSTGVVAVPAG